MRKKLSCIILSLITLICACTFVSCKKEEDGETDITPPKPLAPPIAYLYFDCIEDAASFLNTKDSSFIARGGKQFEDSKFEDGYNNMIKEFERDGYILYATSSVAEVDKMVGMIPQYNLEDVGIRYVFHWGETSLKVIISMIDDSKAMSFKVNSPCSYIDERFGIKNYSTNTQVEINGQPLNIAVGTIKLSDSESQLSMIYFLDSSHYVEVCSYDMEITQKEIINFIATLRFEKIYFSEGS